jgi:hypothetical protein
MKGQMLIHRVQIIGVILNFFLLGPSQVKVELERDLAHLDIRYLAGLERGLARGVHFIRLDVDVLHFQVRVTRLYQLLQLLLYELVIRLFGKLEFVAILENLDDFLWNLLDKGVHLFVHE